jgi:hypothetical protein
MFPEILGPVPVIVSRTTPTASRKDMIIMTTISPAPLGELCGR